MYLFRNKKGALAGAPSAEKNFSKLNFNNFKSFTMSNKSTLIMREKQRAARKAEDLGSFIARNYWLWVSVAFFIYPSAALLSAFTEGSNIWFRFSSTGAPTLLVALAVLLLVFIIEALSYFLGKGSIDDVQAGVFSMEPSDIAMWAVKTLGFVAIMSFSVFLSVNGAPLLNEKLRKSYTPPTADYISIDSIQAAYAAELAPHQENITKMQKTTWKGAITRDANRSIMKSQDVISQIERRRSADIEAATAENNRVKTEWEEETDTNSSYAMGFAGLGELVKLFCLIFIGLYDQGLSREAAIFGGSSTPPPSQGASAPLTPTPAQNGPAANWPVPPPGNNQYGVSPNNQHGGQNGTAAAATDALVQPIGFRLGAYSKPSQKTEPDPVATGSYSNPEDNPAVAIYLDAYKSAKSTRDSWLNKQTSSPESIETKARNVSEWEAKMAVAEAKLSELGYRIVLRSRRYSLVSV